MKVTTKIQKALSQAARLHAGQTRRADNATPYIVHPVAVAWILSNHTADENVIAAGLLHDTLEDTRYTAEEMEKDFGKTVREIVAAVSEPKITGNVQNAWAERKSGYLKQLHNAPTESLMVAAADKIHNLSSLMDDYEIYGDQLLAKFHSSVNQRLAFDRQVLELLKEKLKSPIVSELESVLQKAGQVFAGK